MTDYSVPVAESTFKLIKEEIDRVRVRGLQAEAYLRAFAQSDEWGLGRLTEFREGIKDYLNGLRKEPGLVDGMVCVNGIIY